MTTGLSSTDMGTVRNLLNTLILLQGHLRLYGENNANIALVSSRMMRFVEQLLADRESFTVYIARHAFMLDDGLIDRNNRNFESFANRLFQHGIAALTLDKWVNASDIRVFLQLTARKPAETWDEGGMSSCLLSRNIRNLSVREMAEADFLLNDAPRTLDEETLRQQHSTLWERFALSILHDMHSESLAGLQEQEITPLLLANETIRQLQVHPLADKMTFARDASRFLLNLKHEKIRIYRAAAVSKLAEYVNLLSPELRKLFFENMFNLNLDADLSEGFMSGLSDQAVLEALHNATLAKNYAPPIILKLLGRLANERGLVAEAEVQVREGNEEVVAGRLKEVFKADDFDKYVPKPYQEALLSIISNTSLPVEITENLAQLKRTLEPKAVDQHLGDILIEILRGSPDLKHIEGLRDNLLGTVDFYLSTKNYRKLKEVAELCRNGTAPGEVLAIVWKYLSAPRVTTIVLDDLPRLDRDSAGDAWTLIYSMWEPFVGPLLDRLDTESNRSTRSIYLKALLKLGSGCVTEATARLEDSRWFVVRNMIYLLRELGDPVVLPHIRKHLDHPHPKVSREALRTCLVFKDSEAVIFLLRALDVKNEGDLISAITLATLANDSRVIEKLLVLLHSGTLLGFNFEVRRAVIRSLAALSPRQALPHFEEILATRSLMQTKLHDALKIEIINNLEKIPVDDATRLLGSQVHSSSMEVARAAQLALQKLTGESRGH